MPLSAGTRIGPYEVVAPLGAGGMGEVYRARDTNLNRDVALKILPDVFATDPDRLARFRREAHVLASLNHTNIAGIYGVEDAGPSTSSAQAGIRALVLELVDGLTLAERIALGPIPVPEAIAIASQIAGAIAAAHEQGVIHRDLKPANIKLRPDGTVKVLDFGLAKALDQSGGPGGLPTLTRAAEMTGRGVVLGTPAYMSPEQARGLPLDRRVDIWSFGCVFYEMLTGRSTFAGDTASDAIASILAREPDWLALPPSATALAPLLRRCLEKDAARRLRDISDVTLWLEDAGARPPSAAAPLETQSRLRRWVATAAVLGVAAGVAAAAFLLPSRTRAVPAVTTRFELASSSTDPFTAEPAGVNVAISPDGSRLVYTAIRDGATELVVRRLDQLQGTPIAGTEGGQAPFFSPDGEEIGFVTFDAIKRVPVAGGPVTTICPADAGFRGAAWSPDGTIIFSRDAGSGLLRVPAAGGTPEKVIVPDVARGEENLVQPVFLPDGRALLYTVILRSGQTRVVARKVGDAAAATVVEGGFGGLYVPSGHVVFGQGDRLMAIRFDAATLRVSGSAAPVEDGTFNTPADGVASFASAADGTAVYVAGHNAGGPRRLVWIDRKGARTGYVVNQTVDNVRNPRLSPDGRRLAMTLGRNGQGDVWIYDLAGGAQPLRLTFQGHNSFPVWSPDAKQIAFLSVTTSTGHVFVLPSDGGGTQPERLTKGEAAELPMSWSPDGAFVLFGGSSNVYVLQLNGRTARRWFSTPFHEFGARFSPDGRWVAYASDQAGPLELWVRPFAGPGAPVRVSSGGGHDPAWSHDGKELFYHQGSKMFSARVTAQATGIRVDAPAVLFEGGFVHDDTDANIRFFDVAADGRFLMIEPTEASKPASIVVAPHWDADLKRLLPLQ